jgi:DNA polymerase-3 subunit delta
MVSEKKPVIYVFHGDDELAITEAIGTLKGRLGDPSIVDMNLTTLDGRSFSFEDFENASKSMPIMADRRLIVVNHPLAFLHQESNRDRFLTLLDQIPEQNAVVLAEYRPLQSERDKRQGKTHWLQEWSRSMGVKVFIKEFLVLQKSQLTGWIMERASKSGGQFDPRAAVLLASLVGDDARLANQEITKLLTYVNFERSVSEQDVNQLTPLLEEKNIFELVDALGNRDQKTATAVFHQLLEDQEQMGIFSMIVRQFRLLLLTREILDQNDTEVDVVNRLNLHPFVARKIVTQARHFSQKRLDAIYHMLLQIDLETKTGVMDVDLNVDLLIAEIT